jgi:hypothetical protein
MATGQESNLRARELILAPQGKHRTDESYETVHLFVWLSQTATVVIMYFGLGVE